MADDLFWQRLDQLVAQCKVVIDRPAGSVHPRYADFRYPHDYGYLEGTLAVDQGGIDVWRGSLREQTVTAVICTVDTVKKDAELKILLGCTEEEAREILGVHNGDQMSGILRKQKSEQKGPSEHIQVIFIICWIRSFNIYETPQTTHKIRAFDILKCLHTIFAGHHCL